MPDKDQENLEKFENKYPPHPNVRRIRTWAGPSQKDSESDEVQRVPDNPTISRPGNRSSKRKRDDGKGDAEQPGDNVKKPRQETGGKPPRKTSKVKGQPGKQALVSCGWYGH